MSNPHFPLGKAWILFLIVILALLFALPANGDSIKDAKAAFETGDFDAAVGILMPLAEAGDLEAQFTLGWLFEQADGREIYSAESFGWYATAAERGHAEAQKVMESIFDYEPTLDGISQAARRGNDSAQIQLGIMYFNGDNVDQDYEQAELWFRESFESPWSTLSQGRIALGIMYHTGRGVSQDYVKACELFEASSMLGFLEEPYNFEVEPLKVIDARPDFDASSVWLLEASGKGDPGAQFCLAIAYFKGMGVEQDKEQAIHWLAQSAEGGHATGQYYLGEMYEQGNGIAKNDARALHWIEKAALQGHAKAQTTLGLHYLGGLSIPKDPEKGKYWLRKAIENGDTAAMEIWGWMDLGEFSEDQYSGTYKDYVYTAPDGLFTARYQLAGGSSRDPCCEETIQDSFEEVSGFGTIVFSNEYGAINGVLYGPASLATGEPLLNNWFHGNVMGLISGNAPAAKVLHEEARRFRGMQAWIAVIGIPGGGVIQHMTLGEGPPERLDSVRGFVVFGHGENVYALMCETNVMSFYGKGRTYDPENWDAFLGELESFYDAMSFASDQN